MLQDQKNKMNLKILEMLRDKGMPSASPFPGEQGFETEDHDLDQTGNTIVGGLPAAAPDQIAENSPILPKKKKLKSPFPAV